MNPQVPAKLPWNWRYLTQQRARNLIKDWRYDPSYAEDIDHQAPGHNIGLVCRDLSFEKDLEIKAGWRKGAT